MIQSDLAVFLNVDEFAEVHTVEGREITVVVETDDLAKLGKIGDNRIHGMGEADLMLMGKVSDFPSDLDPGRLLNVDGREHIVISAVKDMGLVEVTLRQNRTS